MGMLIPKIIHHTRLGTDELPPEWLIYRETWKKHHPDWEMILWTEKNLPKMMNEKLYWASHNTGHKSDVLRYELMYQFGGIYVDLDFVCLKNLEPLLDGSDGTRTMWCQQGTPCRAFVGAISQRSSYFGGQYIETALIGSQPKHPFFSYILSTIEQQSADRFTKSVSERTGPQFFNHKLHLFRHTLRAKNLIHIFPQWCFYPYMWDEKYMANEEFPNAYAVHRWWGTWNTQNPSLSSSILEDRKPEWLSGTGQ